MKILCLDIEGGYGGSSRSLFESIRHMTASMDAEVEVWCRRQGPVQDLYTQAGVPWRVTPLMPHISSLPRLSRNIYAYGRQLLHWRRSAPFRRMLADVVRERFDLVHLNHEGLFLLGRWLRSELGSSLRLTAHVRTRLPSTIFSRWQYRVLSKAAETLVFITDMERDRVSSLTERPQTGPVVYNIVAPQSGVPPDSTLADDERFKIASVSNYAWVRGNDRLVDMAAALRDRGRHDVLFVVAGRMELSGNLSGTLGRIAHGGGTLADYASERGVEHMFRFLGHVADPAPVLNACDMLARPSRGDDPWGREVLEAMAAGLPVLATGTYDRFVENDVTGVLHDVFDPGRMADTIIGLADDRPNLVRLGAKARSRVAELCDGPTQAKALTDLWREVVA